MREMKDSGIGWIKEIPINWDLVRNKYNFALSKYIIGSKWCETQLLSLTKNGVKEINDGEQTGKVPASLSTYQKVAKNDIVMCLFDLDCSAVFSGRSKYDGMISPAYKCFKCNESLNPEYVDFYFRTVFVDRKYMRYSKNVRYSLASDEFLDLPILVPPIDEQKRIAAYLDEQCKKIDEIMADIQNQIDTLEDYKKSVISEAVTRGLNPDAAMKDSEIAFVGKIPAHWELHPVYYYFSEGKIKNTGCTENNLLSLSYGNIIRKDINTSEGLLPASFSTYNIVEKDDIIIRPTDLQNDKRSLRTGLVKEKGIITSAYIDLKPKTNVNSRYFHYLLHSYDVKKVFYNMGNGVRQGLNFGEFSKLSVFNPPIKEQEEIAEYLDSKCAKIDSIIENKKTQLETIENYKKSLIYEYVTGKKEVPENE